MIKYSNIFMTTFMIGLFTSCSYSQEWTEEKITIAKSFDEISHEFEQPKDDKIHFINFWATWCKPCVKELPYIEELHEHYTPEELDLVLVSLDFEKDLEKKYLAFLNEHKIQSRNILLLDGKYNNWIDKVDPTWSGAIPVSLIMVGDQRIFLEQDFHSTKQIIDIITSLKK